MILLKFWVEIRCCGAEKYKLPRLLRRVHSLTYQLRGALKTSHCDVFLTGCSIPDPLSQKVKAPQMGAFLFGADDGNRTHTISLEG